MLALERDPLVLNPDQSRLLLRPFNSSSPERVAHIVARVLALPEAEVEALLVAVTAEFSARHHHVLEIFRRRFEEVSGAVPPDTVVSESRRLLIGSYFLAEYALESAALFNPSIVPHPDQAGLSPGALRFILSLRATGEGHISSLTFRTGILHPDQRIEILAPTGFLTEPRQVPNSRFDRALFGRKLDELHLATDFTQRILSRLSASFVLEEMEAILAGEDASRTDAEDGDHMRIVARSNHEVQFQPEQDLSARILFPVTPAQRNGIEDARFVRFQNDDGSYHYYATFTAFDGSVVLPELLETADFLRFRFLTLNGPAAINKGMALFPRRIGGRYAMLSRQDNESIYLMYSYNLHFWNEHQLLLRPSLPWELVQIGNCGSPIETSAGWLVLSHGVGPIRKYCLAAFLLDRNDPSRVIGRLRQPLLEPNSQERLGYVPNVVYTCGALLYQDRLIIPYGLADHATGFATVPLAELLSAME